MERGIENGSTGFIDRESRLVSLRREMMNGEGNRELKHGTHRSRVEAHIVETRDDEVRKMDLLFTVARCLEVQ